MSGAADGGHLLLLHIGPVQDFIASARRCQDLWFGSWLLSELSLEAARSIEESSGAGALVFPNDLAHVEHGVGNKILVVLPSCRDPGEAAAAAGDALRGRLRELGSESFQRIRPEGFHGELARAQVEDLIEYYWVSAPLEPDYASARARAETLMDSRKRTRTWGPVPWKPGPGIPKSSLDGMRESVLEERLFEEVRRKVRTASSLRKDYLVRPSERLCGVGILKRAGAEGESATGRRIRPVFHSASHTAASPLLTRAARMSALEAGRAYVGELGKIGIDLKSFRVRAAPGSGPRIPHPWDPAHPPCSAPRLLAGEGAWGHDGVLLFESRMKEMAEEYSSAAPKEVGEVEQAAKAALSGFLHGALRLEKEPCPYFALLLADGDRLGAAIDSMKEAGQHRQLSMALSRFSTRAGEVVENLGGSLIYAGGDDVLALLPLHTVLACASGLRTAFLAETGPLLAESGVRGGLSVGVAVAHHMSPLGDVLDQARRAERLAKGNGRDSLAVVLDRRSGATVEFVEKWDRDPAGRLLGWCRRLHTGELPDGFAFLAAEAVRPLLAPGSSPAEGLDAAAASLLRRVVSRRRPSGGEESMPSSLQAELETRFAELGGGPAAAMRLSAEIQISRRLLEALVDAWGEDL